MFTDFKKKQNMEYVMFTDGKKKHKQQEKPNLKKMCGFSGEDLAKNLSGDNE